MRFRRRDGDRLRTRRRGLGWLTAVAAGIALCAIPASAAANPAYEPNDGIHQAFGPVQGGTNYDGTISSSEDDDWYIVYVSGPGTLGIELSEVVTGTCGGCASADVSLYDQDGGYLNEASAGQGGTDTVTYTTPGPGFYYAVARGGAGYKYRLRFSGPLTDGPRPGPGEATPNASRDMASAYGPLAGGKLDEASLDGAGEEDWFFFYTAGAGTFDVTLTTTFTGTCGGCERRREPL